MGDLIRDPGATAGSRSRQTGDAVRLRHVRDGLSVSRGGRPAVALPRSTRPDAAQRGRFGGATEMGIRWGTWTGLPFKGGRQNLL